MNNGYVEILKCRTIINSSKFISGTRTQTETTQKFRNKKQT